VRELRNYVQRAYIMADDVIECDVAVSEPTQKSDDGTTITIRVGTPLEEVERRVTMATLVYCGHVKRKAAEILGVSLKTLYNRLEAYNGKEGLPKDAMVDQQDTAESARGRARRPWRVRRF
jgi:DNA-binding NtrC family response regulator